MSRYPELVYLNSRSGWGIAWNTHTVERAVLPFEVERHARLGVRLGWTVCVSAELPTLAWCDERGKLQFHTDA